MFYPTTRLPDYPDWTTGRTGRPTPSPIAYRLTKDTGDVGTALPDLGAYQLKERIGRGGWARSTAPNISNSGARSSIKIFPANLVGESGLSPRFEREASSAAALTHPNILAIYDYVRALRMP
ncbi:MAG: hypothetical protein U0841_19010 [Chloroflexia bacterium]